MDKKRVEVKILHVAPEGDSSVAVDENLMQVLHSRDDFVYGSQGNLGGRWISDIVNDCSKRQVHYRTTTLKFDVPVEKFDAVLGVKSIRLFDYKAKRAGPRDALWDLLNDVVDSHHGRKERERRCPIERRSDDAFARFALSFEQHLPEWFEQTGMRLAVLPMRNTFGGLAPTAMIPKRYVKEMLVEVTTEMWTDYQYHLSDGERGRVVLNPPPLPREVFWIAGRPGAKAPSQSAILYGMRQPQATA